MGFGSLLGGWLNRPGESKRTSDQIILFAKYTLNPGKRNEFQDVLLSGLPSMEKDEPGTLSVMLIEDDTDGDVTYVMERFNGKSGMEAHGKGAAAAKAMPIVGPLVKSREGGVFKEIAGFLSKDE
jgi:quinol monooxygenase YgiN